MTQQPETDSSTPLVGVHVENFKRLQLVELTFDEAGVMQVRGPNEQGKSTLLHAIAIALGYGKLPEQPIHEGADRAEIRLTIGRGKDQLVARRIWTDPADRTRTTFTLTRADGAKYPRPLEVLEKMVSQSADPVAMMRLRPQDLAQQALELVDVPLDLAKHASLLEIAEQRRRDSGRDVAQREGALKVMQEQAAGAPDAPVDTTALAEQLSDLTRATADRAALVREIAQRDQAVAQAAATFQRAQKAAEEALAALHRAENEVRDAALKHTQARESLESAQAVLNSTPEPDGSAIRQQLAGAKEKNEAYTKRQAADRAAMELDSLKITHQQHDSEVQRLRQQRLDALAAVTWPHEGMGYDPETQSLTLKGKPWTQGSTAECLLACTDLAMAKPAQIRSLMVHAGNDLDDAHLGMLTQKARSKGWLVFLERVSNTPAGPGVYLEDGLVKGGDAAAAPAADQEVAS